MAYTWQCDFENQWYKSTISSPLDPRNKGYWWDGLINGSYVTGIAGITVDGVTGMKFDGPATQSQCIDLGGETGIGVGSYGDLGYDLGTENFCISIWYYKQNNNTNYLLSGTNRVDLSHEQGFYTSIQANSLRLTLITQDPGSRTIENIDAGVTVPSGPSWQHYVYLIDRSNQELTTYINGSFSSTVSFSFDTSWSIGFYNYNQLSFTISHPRTPGAAPFTPTSQMDLVKFEADTLWTQSEIIDLYKAGAVSLGIEASSTDVFAGDTIDFSLSGSTEAGVTGSTWSYGDGFTGTGETSSHAYTGLDTYSVGFEYLLDNGVTGLITETDYITVNNINIYDQPDNIVCYAGETGIFSVGATGPTNPTGISYQWYENDSPITGARGATYISEISISDDGNTYNVVVTSPYGSETGTESTLSVYEAIIIDTLNDKYYFSGNTVTWTGAVTGGSGNYIYQWQKFVT